MEKLHKMLHQAELHLGKFHPSQKHSTFSRPDYGQDVPIFTLLFFLFGLAFSILAIALFNNVIPNRTFGEFLISAVAGVLGLTGLAGGSFLVWASRVGKFKMRDQIIKNIHLRGDEQVLDVGCGAGLLLIGAAKQLSTGKATGVDIWDRNLEYGSSPENVWANARIEGVADRVDVKNGSACNLPFPNGSFDLVLTSDMLHHLSRKDRAQALQEMARVLKPGGRLVIAEIAFTKQFFQVLNDCGMQNIREIPLNMILWRGVSAQK